MARISYSSSDGSPMRRLLGHNPELKQAFAELSAVVSDSLMLPADLQEEVRAHCAEHTGCRY